MEIKQFTSKEEVSQAIDLFIQVYAEPPYEEHWSKERALQRLMNFFKNSKEFCFFASDNNKLIGFIFCITDIWDDGIHVFIEDNVVNLDYRGKGIGTKLVQKLEETVKEKRIKGIDLMTSNKSEAYNFWKKKGYIFEGYEILSKKM